MVGYVAAGIFALLLVWMGGSAVTERGVKEPPYVVEREADGYEVRRYEPYLVAEAEVPPGSEEPLRAGFRILFEYIGGANGGDRKIEMTAPVLKDGPGGEPIAMGKPVLQLPGEQGVRVAFVLPAGYTLETAPPPDNPLIRLRTVPSRRVAALRFSGYAGAEVMRLKRAELLSRLERDGVTVTGELQEAYYNPPWTPPFMRRNEVQAEVE